MKEKKFKEKKIGLLKSIQQRDPAAKSKIGILIMYTGVHALIHHRIASFFYKKLHLRAIGKFISIWAKIWTGIEIHPGAQIGRGLFIDHGVGVVIGETTIVGDYCTLYQGVTLGGTGKECGKRHPTLGNHVMVGAGAKILGGITIGDNTKIAANAVVLKDIANDCTAVGVPAQVVRCKGKTVVDDLDFVNIPDPLMVELNSLHNEIEKLQRQIADLEEKNEINKKGE